MNVQQVLDLLGSSISFDYYSISEDISHSYQVKGLVIGVGIELDAQHNISVKDSQDIEETFDISKIKNLFVESPKDATILVV